MNGNKTYYAKKNKIIDIALGRECYFCKSNHNLRCHNIDGVRHQDLACMNFSNLDVALKSKKYVRLCARCHGCVHWAMKFLSLKWEDFSKFS